MASAEAAKMNCLESVQLVPSAKPLQDSDYPDASDARTRES